MQTLTQISPEEYLQQEAQAEHKSEYHAGEVVVMAGAQTAHNRIVANLMGEIGICLKYKNEVIFPSAMLLSLPECEKYVYPDMMIVREEPHITRQSRQGLDVLHNPSVIIEVMSESTALYDRTEKMDCYLKLASLKQYVLVDSEGVEIKTYTRTPENDWLMHTETDRNKTICIGDCEIALQDIYHKVGF
jgi:Uma2 family endonuclease